MLQKASTGSLLFYNRKKGKPRVKPTEAPSLAGYFSKDLLAPKKTLAGYFSKRQPPPPLPPPPATKNIKNTDTQFELKKSL